MDKILRIDMGAAGGPKQSTETAGEFSALGGRATTSTIVGQEVPPDCHPLSSANKLVIAPGMLSGTAAAISGRISVGCKSPLTGGIKESNAGGQAAQVLARLGYAAIIIEGIPEGDDLYKIHINKDRVEISVDNSNKLLDNYPLIDKLKKEYGDKVAYMSIGTAGERLMASASIACTDPELRPTRHCGRGGVGAVMGSKKIKVIILDDAGCKNRPPKDADRFKAANRAFVEGIRKHPVSGEGLPAYGTNILTNVLNEAGGYPTNNFKTGQFEGGTKISGEAQAELETSRGGKATHGCHRGCVIQCSGIYNDKDGNYLTKQPEYETVWSHGGHCGISDLDTIATLDYWDDNVGVDTIEMGVALGIAMDGGVIDFGDCEGAISLLRDEVAKGTALGRILGGGAEMVGKAFGVTRVPVVKSQALPAYDPRTVQGIGVTYATSTMGADHTAGYAVATNILKVGGDVDPLKPEGQVELSRNLQIATTAIDSTGLCLFIAFPILDQPETFQSLLDLLGGFYGIEMTGDDVVALGQKVLTLEREFNKRAGFSSEDDRLPAFFKTEKLPPHNLTFGVTDEELDQLYNWN